jgi:hypothetical protein
MFNFSLGGVSPLPANTRRGTIVNDAANAPAAPTNSRRVTVAFFFMTVSL